MNLKVCALGGIIALAVLQVSSAQKMQADAPGTIIENIDARRDAYVDVAKQIWGFSEVGYQEAKSSALLQARLSDAGFTVRRSVAGMPTAFIATSGTGRPVIAFVGEFDALPGLSQEVGTSKKPVIQGGPGHGCGHNLLGVASMAAAIATREWLAGSGRPGTVRYYGTPAEEGGSGKVYMVRAGLFDAVDVAISWHPGDQNQAGANSTLANLSAKFRFPGVAAHAAAAPDRGRSALEAVEASTSPIFNGRTSSAWVA
jgi:aminobenzoyl-glutamate utilization protein B